MVKDTGTSVLANSGGYEEINQSIHPQWTIRSATKVSTSEYMFLHHNFSKIQVDLEYNMKKYFVQLYFKAFFQPRPRLFPSILS